jgi:DNA-binding MarR family transcriptional regulator
VVRETLEMNGGRVPAASHQSTTEGGKIGHTQMRAFRSFLTAHMRITQELEAELLDSHQMSLASFDVLVQLYEAPEHRLRMAELAHAVLLSRSGVSRIVDRLEVDGLVTRGPANGDGRGVIAVLTDKGVDRFDEVAATHLRGIEEHFVARLNPVELVAIDHICRRLCEVTEPDGG